MLAISACLLGANCKYNGGNNKSEKLVQFLKDKPFISFCPEKLGGLPVPRVPSEIKDGRVLSKSGVDLTEEFLLGARLSLKLCEDSHVTLAILKANSPSCGTKTVYDGTFSNHLIHGKGITAQLLENHNIVLFDEHDLDEFEKVYAHSKALF